MDAQNRDEKLKELEKSLAEELDVASTNQFDAAANNNIMVNPTLVSKVDAPESSPKKKKRRRTESDKAENPDEIPLDQLDAILTANDPAFANELATIRKELVDADVKIGDGGQPVEPTPEGLSAYLEDDGANDSFVRRVRRKIQNIIQRGRRAIRNHLIPMFLAIKSGSVEIAKTIFFIIKGMSFRQWTLILIFGATVGFMGFLFSKGDRLLEIKSHDFVGSFADISDAQFETVAGEPYRFFREDDDQFNFVVEYSRLIVNLKPSRNSTRNPMATFVLFFEGSSKETAIELKDREKMIRDLAARLAEEMNYDEFMSMEGKTRYKLLLRKEANRLLNKGRLRSVMFSTVLIKP